MKFTIFLFSAIITFSISNGQIITTKAGNFQNSMFFGDNGDALLASLNASGGMAMDNKNNLYIASNDWIRKIDATTNIITTIAGTGVAGSSGDGGLAVNAQINPISLAIDKNNNIYINNAGDQIRKIDAITNIITTLAGIAGSTPFSPLTQDGASAKTGYFYRIRQIAIDSFGTIYFTEPHKSRIRKIDTTSIVATVTGTGIRGNSGDGGVATNAQVGSPYGITVDKNGTIYFSDADYFIIRKIDPVTHIINKVAGIAGTYAYAGNNGPANLSSLAIVNGFLSSDSSANVYMVDDGNFCIRKINASDNTITTIAGPGPYKFIYYGDDSLATNASIMAQRHLTASQSGVIYFYDNSRRIRKIDPITQIISTSAGNGGYTGDGVVATNTLLNMPMGLAIDPAYNMYITDINNYRIRKVDPISGIISTIAGVGSIGFSADGTLATEAKINIPSSYMGHNILSDHSGNIYFIDNGSAMVRRIDAATNIITTVAGTGTKGYSGDGGIATAANINARSITMDKVGNLYITGEYRVRKIDTATKIISTIAGTGIDGYSGNGGIATAANIDPYDISVDKHNNIFIAELFDSVYIRKIEASTNIITPIAGNGRQGTSGNGGLAINATMQPFNIWVDDSDYVYLSADINGNIRRIDPVTNIITLIAGTMTPGCTGDGGSVLNANINPSSITLDIYGNIYMADGNNNVVRKITYASPPLFNIKAGSWSDPSVWSNNQIPDSDQTIILKYDITIDSNATCKSLSALGHAVTIAPNTTLTITGQK
ncbi:hypothetical protein LK994_04230 [Ferruginibacter lapsinanis]|uniref:NHL domain-containing protein n=1 Tax=Ferruginibacter lapsinanis TaxID=563172 RepID=UPI001E3A14BE|nr:hypothetical protein [Ferruginibacter lapsinanis]UEG50679.1 hypothetical protein LK994_04230 [Ferruginibacter lapsinanis]